MLTGVSVAGEEVEQGTQHFRFDLVDSLTRETIGTVDLTRDNGTGSPTAVLATLTEPTATYLRVSAEVRAESTCHGCDSLSAYGQEAVWHTWRAMIQYDKAD